MPYANILQSLRALIEEPMGEQAPTLLRESADSTRSCLQVLLPNLVGSIVHLGSSSLEGSSTLQRVLNSPAVDAGLPTVSVNGLFAGGVATDGLVTSGKALLSDLFGRKISLLNEAAVGQSGLRDASGAVLLAMAIPFVLGFLKREAGGGERWIAASVMIELLEVQKPHLRGRLSERLYGPFGTIDTIKWLEPRRAPMLAQAVADIKPVEESVPPASSVTKPEKKGVTRWLAWIVLALLALLLLDYCMKRTPETTQGPDQLTSAPAAASPASDATASAAQLASVSASETVSGVSVAGAQDASNALAVANGTTAASDMAASAAVPNDVAAGDTAANGAPELKVYFAYGNAAVKRDFTAKAHALLSYAGEHADARFSVSGFTDPSGNPALNDALADRRAIAVRSALVKDGVALSRIDLKKSETTTADVPQQEARRAEVHVMQ